VTDELTFQSAVALAAALRSRELSAREIVEANLAQIERINPQVNAIVTIVAEQAVAAASRADDLLASGAEIGSLHGCRSFAKTPMQRPPSVQRRAHRSSRISSPTSDELLVRRELAAGAIALGKTNVPECAAGSHTFNPVFRTTLNPYDVARSAGGSSGGAAVALATGMAPLADGSDMGGSLRNPASFCNVVGFRPSPGRVPSWPAVSGWSILSVRGPMARSVADVALLLSAIAGPTDPGTSVTCSIRSRRQTAAARDLSARRRPAACSRPCAPPSTLRSSGNSWTTTRPPTSTSPRRRDPRRWSGPLTGRPDGAAPANGRHESWSGHRSRPGIFLPPPPRIRRTRSTT
jgi:Asp-tRNA(Asn)/Glu-tRNA(Gln) amidotransferase A subunit family amidase